MSVAAINTVDWMRPNLHEPYVCKFILENSSAYHFFFVLFTQTIHKMSYGSAPYTAPPPRYDEESAQPLMGQHEDDDMFKEMVANSSKEVRLRKFMLFLVKMKAILTAVSI